MKQFLLFTALLIMFLSCEKSQESAVEADVSFFLEVSEMSVMSDGNISLSNLMRTKTNSDIVIDNLWVLQFDGVDDVSALMRTEPVYIANVGGMTVNGSIQLVLKGGVDQSIYFIANTHDSELVFGVSSVYTLGEFIEKNINVKVPLIRNHIPMIGSFEGTIDQATISESSKVVMERLFAKVNFSYEVAKNLILPELWEKPYKFPKGQTTALKITQVELYNSPGEAGLFPVATPDSVFAVIPGSIAEMRDIMPVGADTDSSSAGKCIFYMPENIGGVVNPTSEASPADGGGWNDFRRPSDKYGDFNADGEVDSPFNAKASYVLLTGVYFSMDITHTATNADTLYYTQDVTFKTYLGNMKNVTPKLYNNFNVNVNYSYNITNNISTVNSTGNKSTDQRITISEKTQLP